MERITESEYMAGLDLCKRYIAQCQNDLADMDIRASRFKGIKHMGLSTRTLRRFHVFVRRRAWNNGIKSDELSPYEEFSVLSDLTRNDLRGLYGVGAKGDKEIIDKLSEYGIELKKR